MGSFKDHCPDPVKVREGVKMPLFNQDGGISDDYLMIRWVYSDEVRSALDDLKRQGAKRIQMVEPGMDAKTREDIEAKNQAVTDELVPVGFVSQIASWSFKEKLTKNNVLAYIKANPDVAERIETVGITKKLFFTDSGTSS